MVLPKFKNINGIILIDKPYGFSSNNILQKIKKILKVKKIGHTGSLDPLATGILPICCGKATKFSQFLINAKKRYHVIAKLGQKTSTSDLEGKIIEIKSVDFTNKQLYKTLEKFRGKIKQIPSMYSAIKYRGQALYKYARKGISIYRNSREITIYKLTLLGYTRTFLELDIICSKGTYIRTLIEDLGESLNCGAHVFSLRRLKVGNFSVSRTINISTLNELEKYNINFFKKKILISINDFLSFLPKVTLSTNIIHLLKNGQKVYVNLNMQNKLVRVVNRENEEFIGIGKVINNKLQSYYCII